MTNKSKIQAIFYNNPDGYPPIINSSRLLAQAGFELDIFCRKNDDVWRVAYPTSVHLQRIDIRGAGSWKEYLGFVQRILRLGSKKTAIFVGHDMHGLLPARILATRYRRPLVYHCHDYADANDAKRIATRGVRLIRDFEQRFARTADLVIVPDAERGALMARELRLRQAPLIVANAPLAIQAPSGAALFQALAERGKKFKQIVLRQGRIGPGHAIAATVRSIPLWSNRDWGFVVMGLAEPDYLRELTQMAQALNVESQFVVLPPVGYDEVAQFTAGATLGHALYDPIHINHATATTSSNKLMEYMAAELPLLVSDRPALRSLVRKHNCGVIANEASPTSIAQAINDLLSNPDGLKFMGVAARQAFETVYSYERQFAPAIEALKQLSGFNK